MYYCDKNCQKLDWSEGHKYECPELGVHNLVLELEFDCFRFVLRLWLYYKFSDKKSKAYDYRCRSWTLAFIYTCVVHVILQALKVCL